MRRLPQEMITKIIKLREEGYMYKEIAEELGVLRYSVGTICRRYARDLRFIALPRMDEETINNITRMRKMGRTYKEIGDKVGYHETTVMEICHKYCPGLNNIAHPRRLDKRIQGTICSLYEQGMTMKDVSRKLNIGYKGVHNTLLRNGFIQKRHGRLIRH